MVAVSLKNHVSASINLKGVRVGGSAQTTAALVLVNLGGATGSEVVKLAEEVVRSVKEKFGVAIHPEVNFIGVKQ